MRARTLLGALLRLHLMVIASTCILLVAGTMLIAGYLGRSDQEQSLDSLSKSACRGIELEREEMGVTYFEAARVFLNESAVEGFDVELFDRDGALLSVRGNLAGWPGDGSARAPSGECASRTVMRPDDHWVRYRYCARRCESGHTLQFIARDVLDQHHVRRAAGALLLVLPVAILAGALAGRIGIARLLQPLQALRRAVTDMEARPGLSLSVGAVLEELATLESAFDNLLHRLGDAIDREKRFTQEASHELRTPLTVLRTRLESLAAGLRERTDASRELKRALRDLESIDRLIEALLVLAHSDSAALPTQPVNLCDLAREVAQAQASGDGDGSPPPEVEAPDEILVNGSEELITRALANVVENARKHGGVGARIRVRVTHSDGCGIVLVEDNGPGIAPDTRPYIFDRFSRGPSARGTVPGSGLGLAVVEAIVLRHRGVVESGPSELGGESIRIALPLLTHSSSHG